jgi:ubiquinone/menaquinone biosynthesis C-methylase UbiE
MTNPIRPLSTPAISRKKVSVADSHKAQIHQYFEEIAPSLDAWSKRNRYYYQDIDRWHQFLMPAGSTVLEIGCGTGNLLAAVKPSIGVGIDFSEQAIHLAKAKYPQFHFLRRDAEFLADTAFEGIHPDIPQCFDFIVISGTLGYLSNIQTVLNQLHVFCHPQTRVILAFHNFLWEPLLNLAEKIGQRRPQPQQNWLSMNDTLNLLTLTGYTPVKLGRRFLMPKRIPLLSTLLNRYLVQLPGLNHLGLTNTIVARSHGARPRQQQQSSAQTSYSVSVVIPARNEAGNIAAALERLPQLGHHTEVIFVEGHSSDNTWQEIQRVSQTYSGRFTIKTLQQSGRGKADAVRLGFAEASGDILIILDADLTVQPEDLPLFYQAIASNRGEFINGSRLVYPRSLAAMPWLNTLANKFFASVFSFLLGQHIKDTLCGTKVLWRKDYQRIVANRHYFGDFDPFGDFDLLFGAAKLNLQILEVPVRYQPRSYGSSNIAHVKEGLILLKMCLYAAQKIKFI